MDGALGVGLAATQLGVLHRVLVYRVGSDAPLRRAGQPRDRVARRRARDRARRGASACRPCSSTSSGRCTCGSARSMSSGQPITIEAAGLEARVIQHEIDHLDGVLILDRTSREQRKEAMRALREAHGRLTVRADQPRAHRLPRHLGVRRDACSSAWPRSPHRPRARRHPAGPPAGPGPAGSPRRRSPRRRARLGLELAQPDDVGEPQARAQIAAHEPEAVVVCAFGALIREPLLSAHPMLNVHPSLLPRWRGAAPVERAIMAGDERTGVSIMALTAGLDSGPVYAAARGADRRRGHLRDARPAAGRARRRAAGRRARTAGRPAAPQPEDGVDLRREDHRRGPAARPGAPGGRAGAYRPGAVAPHRRVRRAAERSGASACSRPGRSPDGPAPRARSPATAALPVLGTAAGGLELADGAARRAGGRWPARTGCAAAAMSPGAGSVAPARARGRTAPSGGCSNTGPTPTARCGARADGLDARDRALATQLVFGTVQRRATLDHVIDAPQPTGPAAGSTRRCSPRCASGSTACCSSIGPRPTPPSATASSSSSAARRGRRRLVNAVLRRAAREGAGDPRRAATTPTPAQAAIRALRAAVAGASCGGPSSGRTGARRCWRAINEPAEAAVRVNTLRADRRGGRGRLPVPSRPAPGLPEGLVLDAPFDVHGSELFAEGASWPSRGRRCSSARIARPAPGERVLDLCAAPGGKTTHLAALAADAAEIVAVERHPGRGGGARATCGRMGRGLGRGAGRPTRPSPISRSAGFDRVLVDPPCSGLGTLRSRPDLRWRASPERDRGARRARRPGSSTRRTRCRAPGARWCTPCARSPGAEGARRDRRVPPSAIRSSPPSRCRRAAGLGDPPRRRTCSCCPDLDGTDGFFIARLRRG